MSQSSKDGSQQGLRLSASLGLKSQNSAAFALQSFQNYSMLESAMGSAEEDEEEEQMTPDELKNKLTQIGFKQSFRGVDATLEYQAFKEFGRALSHLQLDQARTQQLWDDLAGSVGSSTKQASQQSNSQSQNLSQMESMASSGYYDPASPVAAYAPIREEPLHKPFYKLRAVHCRYDPYYEATVNTGDLNHCPYSDKIMHSQFTAENWYKRTTIRHDEDYRQRHIREALFHGDSKVPDSWEAFKDAFSSLDNFSQLYQVELPGVFPPALTNDQEKIDFALGLPVGTVQKFIDRWNNVTADFFTVALDGSARFQPAFAGLMLFFLPNYDRPSFYIIVSADGAGLARALFINCVSPADSPREIQGTTGFKFSPLGHVDNFYSHAITYSPSGLMMTLDCYWAAFPPQFYWEVEEGNHKYMRVSIEITPQDSVDSKFYLQPKGVKALNKGLLMERITAPYFPMESAPKAWRRVLDPCAEAREEEGYGGRIGKFFGALGLSAATAVYPNLFDVVPHFLASIDAEGAPEEGTQ